MEIICRDLQTLICNCWRDAEAKTIDQVMRKHFVPSEEFLTSLFAGELREKIEEASNRRKVERALIADIRRNAPELSWESEGRLSGLLARVNFHSKAHEGKKSGSDLGIVFRRPILRFDFSRTHIEITEDNATGLLAQAKLGVLKQNARNVLKWNGLTNDQQRLYPQIRDYYSLLLYRIRGIRKNELSNFGWQLCTGYKLAEVKSWLKEDQFPDETQSIPTLEGLFTGKIGTTEPEIIRTIIDPQTGKNIRTLEIEVFWPDGSRPPQSVSVSQESRQVQVVYQRY